LRSFRCPRGVDLELVFWAPLEQDLPAAGVLGVGRRGLEVLPDDLELSAAVTASPATTSAVALQPRTRL